MFKKIITSVLATLMLLIVLPTKVNASTQPITTYSTVNARSGSKKIYGIAELRQLNTDCSVNVIKRYYYNYTYDVVTQWW